jgi:hypothetical protein
MAVENTTTKIEATGNGSATVFSFSPIVVFEPRAGDGGTHDLEVTLVTIATEAETVLTEGNTSANYSVSVSSYPGTGSITYPATGGSPIAATHKLVIKRKLRLKQYESLNNQGGYFADTQEEMHDRHRMVDLQQQEELDRAVKVPIGSDTDPDDLLTQLTADAATAAAAATTATTQAGIATTQAGIATTQASNAAASAAAAAAAAASGLFAAISDKSADFTIVADTDNTTLFKVDTSGGNVTATLPSIATAGEGERYGFMRTSASNTFTLARNGSDTINGVAGNYTVSTTVGNIILIVADDATPDNWIVIVWALVQADGTSLSQSGNTLSLNLGNRNTFTAPQRSTPVTDNDGSFDLNAGQDFLCTPTGAVALTFTNKPSGQKGTIRFTNGSNYAVTRAANVLADSDFNALVSATGTYIISYWSYDGTNVAVSATQALT